MAKHEHECDHKHKDESLKDRISIKVVNGGGWKGIAKIVIIAVVVILALTKLVDLKNDLFSGKKKSEPEIITETALYNIINVDKLSTYECVYNGICRVYDDDGDIAYYVSYESSVKAGINFRDVKISIDEDTKVISITVPKVGITEVNVDIGSLDYIFEDSDYETDTVSADAYAACKKDAEAKCTSEDKIFELAEQNGVNIIQALVNPFVEQFGEEYTVNIQVEGRSNGNKEETTQKDVENVN